MSELHEGWEDPVPEKCKHCGIQCELGRQAATLFLLKGIMNQLGENLVGESGEEADKLIEAIVPEEYAEEAKTTVRQSVGQSLTDLDNQIEDVTQVIKSNAQACSGTLNMRASRDNIRYTVYTCTSARVHLLNDEEPQHLSLQVRAETQL